MKSKQTYLPINGIFANVFRPILQSFASYSIMKSWFGLAKSFKRMTFPDFGKRTRLGLGRDWSCLFGLASRSHHTHVTRPTFHSRRRRRKTTGDLVSRGRLLSSSPEPAPHGTSRLLLHVSLPWGSALHSPRNIPFFFPPRIALSCTSDWNRYLPNILSGGARGRGVMISHIRHCVVHTLLSTADTADSLLWHENKLLKEKLR